MRARRRKGPSRGEGTAWAKKQNTESEWRAVKQTDSFGWRSHNTVSMVKCIPHCKHLKHEVLKHNPLVNWELSVLLEIVGAPLPFIMLVFQDEYSECVQEKSLEKKWQAWLEKKIPDWRTDQGHILEQNICWQKFKKKRGSFLSLRAYCRFIADCINLQSTLD